MFVPQHLGSPAKMSIMSKYSKVSNMARFFKNEIERWQIFNQFQAESVEFLQVWGGAARNDKSSGLIQICTALQTPTHPTAQFYNHLTKIIQNQKPFKAFGSFGVCVKCSILILRIKIVNMKTGRIGDIELNCNIFCNCFLYFCFE